MSRSAILIFNPVAGQGDPDQDLALIKQHLEPVFDLKVCQTSPEKSAEDFAEQAKAKKPKCVIVSGGDGTVSAVVSALAKTGIPVGVIPRGTANAFAQALKIPQDTIEACAIIAGGETCKIDLGYSRDRYVTLFASIGFGAEMVEKADRELKNQLGILAYFVAGIQNWLTLDRFEFEIETDERIINGKASAIAIANAAPAFSILAQGPDNIVWDDGLLDITLVAPEGRGSALSASLYLLKTALQNAEANQRKDIGYLRSRRAKITADPPQKVVIDGEMVGTTPIEISLVPQALTLFVPPAFKSLKSSHDAENPENLSQFTVREKKEI
ncbi:MAG: YegS/Rv2252/BmrU family lipid kinase [Jaaginema sp. PMC 1079.18]|nr:YegS/Rv2252/BmrU family lipid kinase [Jaaginema sp. PMC 1080.18]MEC4850482.1 YegS/Rv2252/BmrU family lipid kinase [Jaaginema sp. PMC 1079.18]MEC4867536.1 YegS/Rv2252/BmrU family lipid kinase [Jaaginema sp. PMC 1078.18]